MKIRSNQLNKDFDLNDLSEPLKITIDKIKQQENLKAETQGDIFIDEKQILNQDQSPNELEVLNNNNKMEIVFSLDEQIKFKNEDDSQTFTQQLNIWITGYKAIKIIKEQFQINKDCQIVLKSENNKIDLELPLAIQNVGENLVIVFEVYQSDDEETYFKQEPLESKTDSSFFQVNSSNMYIQSEAFFKLINLDEDQILYATYSIQDIKKYVYENKLDDSIFVYQSQVVQLSDDFQIEEEPLCFFRLFKISFKISEKVIYQKSFDINSTILQVKQEFQQGYLQQSKIDFQFYFQGKLIEFEKNSILRNEFSGLPNIEFEVRSKIRCFNVIFDQKESYKVQIQEHKKVDELKHLIAETIKQSLPISLFYDGQQLDEKEKIIGNFVKDSDEDIEVYLD